MPDITAALAKTIVASSTRSLVLSKYRYCPIYGNEVIDSGLVKTAKKGKIAPILTNSAIAAAIINNTKKKYDLFLAGVKYFHNSLI